MPPAKIVSGGQTSADRAALDWAIFHDIPHGGWCPKGRKAEDGILSAQHQLTETPSASYPQRIQWNVRDSDGTVIFTMAEQVVWWFQIDCRCCNQAWQTLDPPLAIIELRTIKGAFEIPVREQYRGAQCGGDSRFEGTRRCCFCEKGARRSVLSKTAMRFSSVDVDPFGSLWR